MSERFWQATALALAPDPVLAVLHRPVTEPAATAVLLCPPFGWEEMCSYRARLVWAQTLAAHGYPAARFDLPGTGDSGGSPRDPARLDAWREATGAVAAWLARESGARRVAALGIGIGGMMAWLAAAAGAPIDDLLLWSVPARGRSLLRELRAHAGIIASRHPEDGAQDPAPDGGLDLIGYHMSAETAQALSAIDLTANPLPEPASRRVMLLGRERLAPDKRLRDWLESAGVRVVVSEGVGYDGMVAHPQDSMAPEAVIRRSITWLGRDAVTSTAPARPVRPALRLELEHGGVRIEETPVRLEGLGGERFAILTTPTGESANPDLCAVLVGAGALRRVGPNRTWVEIARRWAARGVPVVRVDPLGVGDSPGEDVELVSNRCLYDTARLMETTAILDALQERGIGRRYVLGGLCSGAYWALHAAHEDGRVAAALMINLYTFFWSQALVDERDRHASASALRDGMLRRIVTHGVRGDLVRRALRAYRPAALRGGWRGSIEDALAPRIDGMLDELADRETQLSFLFSEGEPLYEQIRRQGHLDRLSAWPNVTVETIPTRDHMFRAPARQREVHTRLDRALERVLLTVPQSPSTG